MLAKTESMAICGISAIKIDVEVDVSSGLPSFSIVGLPDTACREAGKRVVAALKNSGYHIPSRRITVNLAPAYVRKEGSIYELAIALGVLAALGEIRPDILLNKVICAELSLDGSLRQIKGALVIADSLIPDTTRTLILPMKNIQEISVVASARGIGFNTLNEVVTYLAEGIMPEQQCVAGQQIPAQAKDLDYCDIKGNYAAKRAMEIAAAGGHNMLLIGPPGSGKTMLASRLSTILEGLTEGESIETSKIYSVAGMLNPQKGLIERPPFRILHHSASYAGMIGGSQYVRPGEISLAHNGVLFLDELAEFRRDTLEALRQPLEDGIIRLSRANMFITYPAQFMLVAAMNPCPCGFYTHPHKQCSCTPPQIQRYLSKISGPLLDRIDLHIEIQPIKYEQIRQPKAAEPSSAIRERVKRARQAQKARYKGYDFRLNSRIPRGLVDTFCSHTDEAGDLLKKAVGELFMSMRAYDKVLRISRTIADLDAKEIIGAEDVAEAIGYRALETKLWLM